MYTSTYGWSSVGCRFINREGVQTRSCDNTNSPTLFFLYNTFWELRKNTLVTMEFNKIERIAITSILIGMMNVDNDVDLREVLYFNQIQNTIGITQEEFEQGKEQNILLSLVLIKTMSDNKKLALVKMLIEMVKADGKEAPQEMQLFNIIIESTGINKLL